MITTLYYIKIRSFLDGFLRSYQSHCMSIFSDFIINKYGKVIQVKIQYYQPHRIKAEVNLKHLKTLNQFLTAMKEPFQGLDSKHFKNSASQSIEQVGSVHGVQSLMSRSVSPAMDSYILAQVFSYNAKTYNFRRICYHIESKIIYRIFKNALVNYKEKDPLLSKDQMLGLEISLHGRIPREAVRPRKTVQVKIFGRRSKRMINKNVFLINRTESINPELGTFSIWIRQVVLSLLFWLFFIINLLKKVMTFYSIRWTLICSAGRGKW